MKLELFNAKRLLNRSDMVIYVRLYGHESGAFRVLHSNCFCFFLSISKKSFKRVTIVNDVSPRFYNFDKYVAGGT